MSNNAVIFWEKLFDSRFGIFAAQNNIEAAERELITQLNREMPFGGEVVWWAQGRAILAC